MTPGLPLDGRVCSACGADLKVGPLELCGACAKAVLYQEVAKRYTSQVAKILSDPSPLVFLTRRH